MSTTTECNEDDLDIIRDLVLELASEVDMHYDALEGCVIHLTVAAIAAGRGLLLRRGAVVPADVDAILAKFEWPADDDGFWSVDGIFGGAATLH